ncbi:Na+/melibiose symporter [Limimonas halophila]|uniref:Na+/melibiose symporter n=1 Tax=Limimonas halophila TaxID=1082479 RepID=A0A1G7UGE9_9PROT|nr:MFS transporter [Limimonas halophila]SDG46645.1 Na+/melibiose symporter [Limimonas halophila]
MDETRRLLRPWQLLAYAGPGIPLAVLLLPLYVTLPTYYADDLGVGFAAVGTVLFLVRLWDVASDPLIGVLSDRSPNAFGRRRPWMVAGVPILVLAAWQLFAPAAGVGWPHLLIWTVLLYLGGTMIMVPYTAWAAELSPHHHERSRIAAVREVSQLVGTLLALGIPALLGLARPDVMTGTALGLTVLLPLAVGLAVWGLPDRPIGPAASHAVAPGRALKLVWTNGPFRQLIGAYFINGVAYGLPATLFLLYVEHVLRAQAWAWPLLGLYFACAVAAVPGWLWLSRRIGKHRAWMAAMAMAAAGFWPAALLDAGQVGWFVLVCVLTGVPLGGELALPPSMQADVVDYDTLRSGRRRAGLFFAAWGVATKVPLALAVGIAFPALDLVGFQREAAAQTEPALWTLAGLYALFPVFIKLAAIAIVRGYPIDAAEQNRIRDALNKHEDV